MGRAKKRYYRLAAELRKEHPEWEGTEAYAKAYTMAIDIDQRRQAKLQARRWRGEHTPTRKRAPMAFNIGLPGNTAADWISERGTLPVDEAHYFAMMALTYEQRTANLIAWHDSLRGRNEPLQASEVAGMVKGRLGLS